MAARAAGAWGARRPTEALASGDARGFEVLYDEHADAVFRTAMRVLGDSGQAQDVVQEVFMRLWRQPDRFDEARGSLDNYLRVMARSQALDVRREAKVALRARERMQLIVARDDGPADNRPPVAAELHLDRAIVLSALTRLPPPQRQAIVLAYWGGLTADEIARRFGLPVGTVKSRIRLGLRKLRQRCGKQLGGGELRLAA